MKCTKCSAEVRPIVVFDVDGTLGNYHGHFLEFLQGYLGGWPCAKPRDPDFWGYDGVMNFGDWVCEHFEIDRRMYRDIKLAYRQGAQKRSMPVDYPNAEKLAAAAREQGAEIWVATSRPYLRLDNIDPDTRFWLDRHRIVWDHMIYGEDKYIRLAELVDPERVVFVLDDLGEMYDQAASVFGEPPVWLRIHAYNQGVVRQKRVADLLDARAIAVAQIQDWRTSHHFDDLPTTD